MGVFEACARTCVFECRNIVWLPWRLSAVLLGSQVMTSRPSHIACKHIQTGFKLEAVCTVWCIEIGALTSLDAPELHASADVRKPISLHHAVCVSMRPTWLWRSTCKPNCVYVRECMVSLCVEVRLPSSMRRREKSMIVGDRTRILLL